MAIKKSLDTSAIASATSVSVEQKNQQNAANLRPECIVCIGQAQTGKKVATNELILASGNADDAGVMFGFGSPLHRMAIKLFPKAGNGSKVDTYFLPVAAPGTASAEVKTITVAVGENGVTKSLNGYFNLRDMVFEAAADVCGKVATNAHNNPAKAPRGTDLNSYETRSIPFTIIKGMSAQQVAESLADALGDYVAVPFTIDTTDIATGVLKLTAKWTGSDSFFDFSITDKDNNEPTLADFGATFTITEVTEAAGVGVIDDDALSVIDEESGITRVISQYANDTVLDALQEKFEAFHDGLIAQYVICYSAIQAPESQNVPGTWDVQALMEMGDARREDSINVQIVGDYGDLRKLKYPERNRLLKSGYTNIVMKKDGSYRLMDLVSFFHPVGKTNPLFRFDRDITVVGNIAYDVMSEFTGDNWKSIILVAEADVTTNPAARTLKDVKAAYNTRIGLLGIAGLIANYKEAQKQTAVEIDSSNPNRVNINPKYDLTGVGRIFDITNFIGFYFGK